MHRDSFIFLVFIINYGRELNHPISFGGECYVHHSSGSLGHHLTGGHKDTDLVLQVGGWLITFPRQRKTAVTSKEAKTSWPNSLQSGHIWWNLRRSVGKKTAAFVTPSEPNRILLCPTIRTITTVENNKIKQFILKSQPLGV
jgi:hypothetical protein